MSEFKAYRVKVDPLPLKGAWSITFLDRETGEAVGNITAPATSKAAATQYAMGYCTAFFRMGLPVKFDQVAGS